MARDDSQDNLTWLARKGSCCTLIPFKTCSPSTSPHCAGRSALAKPPAAPRAIWTQGSMQARGALSLRFSQTFGTVKSKTSKSSSQIQGCLRGVTWRLQQYCHSRCFALRESKCALNQCVPVRNLNEAHHYSNEIALCIYICVCVCVCVRDIICIYICVCVYYIT